MFVIAKADGKAMTRSSFRSMWECVNRRKTAPTKKARYGSVERCIDFEVTPHLLRHTFLTRCFENGLDMKEVRTSQGTKPLNLQCEFTCIIRQKSVKKRPSAKSERCLLHEKPEIYTSLLPHFAAVKCQFLQKNQAIFVPHLYRTWYQK